MVKKQVQFVAREKLLDLFPPKGQRVLPVEAGEHGDIVELSAAELQSVGGGAFSTMVASAPPRNL